MQDAAVQCQLLSNMLMSQLLSPFLHKADLSYTDEPVKHLQLLHMLDTVCIKWKKKGDVTSIIFTENTWVKFSQAIIYIRTATLLPISGFRLCEVFKMVATRTIVFQDVTLCSLVGRYQTFWMEAGIQLPNYTVLHSRGLWSSGSMTSTLIDETEEVSKMMVSAQF